MPKRPSGVPKRLREAQNGRPQIGNFQSGNAGVEMPGRAGPGRVATETGIRNQAPSKRAHEKIRRSGIPTPHSDDARKGSWDAKNSPRVPSAARKSPGRPKTALESPKRSKTALGCPERPREPRNGFERPKTDGPKSAIFRAETRGSKCPVGPGGRTLERGLWTQWMGQTALERGSVGQEEMSNKFLQTCVLQENCFCCYFLLWR